MYDNVNYADSRLTGTYMADKSNQLLYIERVDMVGGKIKALSKYLRNDVKKWIDINLLRFQPIQLGYVNTKWGANYASRMPMRQDWRQGIRQKVVMGIDNLPNIHKALVAMADNRYPSVDDCLLILNRTPRRSVAFHKQFAIVQSYEYVYALMYKNEEIGRLNLSTQTFELNEGKTYLQEKLQGALDGNY